MATKGRFSGDYRETVAALRGCFAIAVPQVSALDRSLEIHTRAGVSVWDALLIAACAEAGVTTLYTEDLQSQPVIDGVAFVNPFV